MTRPRQSSLTKWAKRVLCCILVPCSRFCLHCAIGDWSGVRDATHFNDRLNSELLWSVRRRDHGFTRHVERFFYLSRHVAAHRMVRDLSNGIGNNTGKHLRPSLNSGKAAVRNRKLELNKT